jgi:Fe-S cluster biogenesis protein NfuA
MTEPDDLKTRIARARAEEVRPALQRDGGDVKVLDIEAGVVRVPGVDYLEAVP